MVNGARVRRVQDLLRAIPGQDHVDVPLGDLAARVAVAIHAHRAQVHQVNVETRLGDRA